MSPPNTKYGMRKPPTLALYLQSEAAPSHRSHPRQLVSVLQLLNLYLLPKLAQRYDRPRLSCFRCIKYCQKALRSALCLAF